MSRYRYACIGRPQGQGIKCWQCAYNRTSGRPQPWHGRCARDGDQNLQPRTANHGGACKFFVPRPPVPPEEG